MQLFMYFSFALLALSSAKQIQNGPQLLSEESYSEPSLKIDKQSTIQKFNLYFTPEKDQVLQGLKSSQNSASIESSRQNLGISEEFYNKLIQKYYAENLKPAPIEEPQEEPARSSSNFFLPREESVYNNKQNYRQLLMDQSKLSGHAQSVQNNKFNQLAKPSVSNSDFFKSTSGSNRNEDQEKLEKEIEIILRNFQIDQLRKFNSLNQIRNQKSGRNVGPKKSAVEEEIENAWRQHQAFEFEKLNSPADISKQSFSLSVSNENPENTEERKQIKYILRNGQAFGFERLNSPTKMNNQDSQGRKELHNDSEIEREIEKYWKKQHDSQFQGLFLRNENKAKSAIDKQIEDIFIPQAFVYERSNSPADISKQSFSLSASNENPENTEERKQIKYPLRNSQPYSSERLKAPSKVNNQDSQGRKELHNDSEIEREIEKFWKKQHKSQFQRFLRNENKEMSEIDKQIGNVFIPQAFVYERLNLPSAVSKQNLLVRNKKQDNTEVKKQIELFFKNRQAEFERENAPQVKSESPLVDQNKSVVEKEIQEILKKHQDFEYLRSKSAAEPNNQRLPIKIHELLSIFKHIAVPVSKTVQVSVPTPVLVPIPQPYEMKVTPLYPVSLKVVNHVPVSALKHY